ncbi:HNH endonuclease [Gemmatimonadota bacterium]
MDETHIAYWELYPTVDHIHPIARGGDNDETNLVTTSQLRNSAKSNWSIDELGWTLHQPGDLTKWDGLMGLSLRYIEMHPKSLEDKLLRKWCNATNRLKKQESDHSTL